MTDDDRVRQGGGWPPDCSPVHRPGAGCRPSSLRQTMANVFGDVWQGEDLASSNAHWSRARCSSRLGDVSPSSGSTSAAPATSASSGRHWRR